MPHKKLQRIWSANGCEKSIPNFPVSQIFAIILPNIRRRLLGSFSQFGVVFQALQNSYLS